MLRREFLKLFSLALVPWSAVKGLCFPNPKIAPPPPWQNLAGFTDGWWFESRYRVHDLQTCDVDYFKLYNRDGETTEKPPAFIFKEGVMECRHYTAEEAATWDEVALVESNGPGSVLFEDFNVIPLGASA